MISCPWRKYILSVSGLMRSLFTGHRFHSRTLAAAVLAVCKQIAFPRRDTAHRLRLGDVAAPLSPSRRAPPAAGGRRGVVLLLSAVHGGTNSHAAGVTVTRSPPPSVKLSALIKTVYQESGTVNEIAWVRASLQPSTAGSSCGDGSSSQHFPLLA